MTFVSVFLHSDVNDYDYSPRRELHPGFNYLITDCSSLCLFLFCETFHVLNFHASKIGRDSLHFLSLTHEDHERMCYGISVSHLLQGGI